MYRWWAAAAIVSGLAWVAVLATPGVSAASRSGVSVKITPNRGLVGGQTVTITGRGLARTAAVVAEELAEMGQGGRLAVIAPGARIGELARAMPTAVPGDRAEVLDSPVALLTVGQSKGLEFDRVVLVDPAGILAQSPAGGHDLYVAITRATHRLTVIHDGDLPSCLHRLNKGSEALRAGHI